MNVSSHSEQGMSLVDSLRELHAVRDGQIVVTTMGSSREWMKFEPHPLDFVYVPSSMGQATSVGLGLALARPDKDVIVCNGDGSMLMNLGSLVTIATAAPPNLTVVLFENGVYEVIGGQAIPGGKSLGDSSACLDFAGLARSAGLRSVHEFKTIDEWRAAIADVLAEPGPTFVVLDVAPIPGAPGPKSPGPAGERAAAFAAALRESR